MKNTIFFLCLLGYLPLFAQQDTLSILDYSKSGDYEIGGITVSGNTFSDEVAIISISGFKIGDRIRIPGGKIQQAIKNLWNLKLFSNVEITKVNTLGDIVFLNITVTEQPRLVRHSFKGVKKTHHDDLNEQINKYLLKGTIITEDKKQNAANAIQQYFVEKGYLDTKVVIAEIIDSIQINAVRLVFEVYKHKKVKIRDITFSGNDVIKSKQLRKAMKETKRKSNLLARSKFIKNTYEDDQLQIINLYREQGYRDAAILSDSMWRDEKGMLHLHLDINEGRPYYFGNIVWKGNAKFSSELLSQVLGISAGEIFNNNLLQNRLQFSENGSDISSIYMDDGYLFFRVEPTEVAIRADTIDLEIRIFEGPQATIDKVVIRGNNLTNDHVIRRELRTIPGHKFSRADIIRSQREIITLGYFNPETLGIETPVNPQRGTVDMIYTLEERPSDQLELSAGWGGTGQGVVGTLGFSFNNFSLRNLGKPEAWNPLPKGDGQRLSVRMQSNGRTYQSANITFTEPWLGGKRPTSFNIATYLNRYTNGLSRDNQNFGVFTLSGGTASIGSRLSWPDDFFVSTTAANLQLLSLNNYNANIFSTDDGTQVSTGDYYNLSISQTISRNSIDNPLFPTRGSSFSLSMQFTPPYSLFSDKDYQDISVQEKYKWIEYHKWRFNMAHYTPVTGKMVLKIGAKLGYMGFYNQDVGISPFERFQLGGDGLNNQAIGFQGTDIISLRGYDVSDLENNILNGNPIATPIFQKITTELRYPISTNPSSTIYVLAFAEAGNSYQTFDDYSFFDMKRSVGGGLRVFLPMFGLLGFDYGWGLDKNPMSGSIGKFSIILGFEPE